MGSKPRQRVTRGPSSRYVAFLRGMNLGRRRITNDELCSCFTTMGFTNPSAFLASGNVIFDTSRNVVDLAEFIAAGLEEALSYDVATFVRTGHEIVRLSTYEPFPGHVIEQSGGKVQVMLLGSEPSSAARDRVCALANSQDRLAFRGTELYWLPEGKMSESDLDLRAVHSAVGPTTMRTKRTIERIAVNYFDV